MTGLLRRALDRCSPGPGHAASPPRAGERGTFDLARHFSTVSFVLIVAAAAALGAFYRHLSLQQLTEQAEARNEAMTEVFHNSVWPEFAAFVDDSYHRSPAQLRNAAEVEHFRERVTALTRNTDVVKVKAYNRDGLTILSTDPRQIGENKLDNAGFRSAIGGTVTSALVRRNSFDTFEGILEERDLISSYIPVVNDDGEIEGVFELYQDITPFLAQLDRSLWWVSGGVVAVFGLLYLLQFLVVRRAHGILRQQGRQLHHYLLEIENTNARLETRVLERTRDLEDSNRRLAAEVAERRQAQQQLGYLAHHDPLTGLPNRLMFNQGLTHGLQRSARAGSLLGLLFIDLDHFRSINDTLGHHVGDALLIKVARRLSSFAKTDEVLARLGGDEFGYMLENVADADEVASTADRILALLAQPFTVADHEFLLSASIGISLFPQDAKDAITLQRNADTAMYRAKAQGRNRRHFYTPELTTYAQERATMERLLRRSIENQELSVHFQPQVEVTTGRLSGIEALVRWDSAELGSISPVRFVGIAEDIGFIAPLGEWVLRQSCRQFMTWRAGGFNPPKVSVNLSVKQLERADVVEVIRAILAETGMNPAWLELEITESAIMQVEGAFKVLEQLRALGIQLSVDDFGTGYSSLNYLKLMPIQKLKIDRSFVVGIGHNSGDEAIIRTVLALAHVLNLQVVAEGVETAAQHAFLLREGCDHIQGNFHGEPIDAATFFARWNAPPREPTLRAVPAPTASAAPSAEPSTTPFG